MGDGKIETKAAPFTERNEEITAPGSALYLENVRFFRENVERIIKAGNKKHVPVLFMEPVCNLKDYRPNFSIHSKSLPPEKLTQWDAFYQRGQEAAKKKDDRLALEFFEQAFAIDPTYADLSFRLGELYFRKGEIEKARLFFEQARDQDVVIRRAPKDILDVFDDLVRREQIHYFDTEKALVSKVPGGILGWPLIEDNVHFSIEGQALVGRALAEEIAGNDWIAPRSEWRFDRERSMADMGREFGISDKTVFLNYGSVISYLGIRYEDRLEFAKKASDLFPEDPIAQRQLAWAYWLLGEKGKALATYKHLGEKYPEALRAAFRAQPEIQQAYEASTLQPANS